MAFFVLPSWNIALIVIGIVFVVGVLVIVALKIFHQNKEDQQVEQAKNGMKLALGTTYTVGKNIAEGKYSFASSDATQNELSLTLNGEEKALTSGDVLTLAEDDVLCPRVDVVATICE